MNKENNKLKLKITLSNISIRFSLWLKMIRLKTKLLIKIDNKLTLNAKSYSNGFIVIKMLLKMNMMKREKNLRLSIILLLRKSMVNKVKDFQEDKVSQEVKDSQVLVNKMDRNNNNNKEVILMTSTELNNFMNIFFKIYFCF